MTKSGKNISLNRKIFYNLLKENTKKIIQIRENQAKKRRDKNSTLKKTHRKDRTILK